MTQQQIDSQNTDNKGPAVRFPPPLVVLSVILASAALHRVVPLPISGATAVRLAGALMIAAGIAITGVSALQFRRAKTHIEPWKPTSQIVSDGIFAYSRNPIYLAFCIIQIGLGLSFNSLWTVALTPLSAWLVFAIAITNEERYLEGKFGNDYLEYKTSVRRWL